MIKNILYRVKCARYIRKICLSHVLLFSCTTDLRYVIIHFWFYTGGGQLYIHKLLLIIQFYLNEEIL